MHRARMACAAINCLDGSVKGLTRASLCVCNPLRLCCGDFVNRSNHFVVNQGSNDAEVGYVYRLDSQYGHSVDPDTYNQSELQPYDFAVCQACAKDPAAVLQAYVYTVDFFNAPFLCKRG